MGESQQAQQESITQLKSLTQGTQAQLKIQDQGSRSQLTEIRNQQSKQSEEWQEQITGLEERIGGKIDTVGENGKQVLTQVTALRNEFGQGSKETVCNINLCSKQIDELRKEMVFVRESQSKQFDALDQKIDRLLTLFGNILSAGGDEHNTRMILCAGSIN